MGRILPSPGTELHCIMGGIRPYSGGGTQSILGESSSFWGGIHPIFVAEPANLRRRILLYSVIPLSSGADSYHLLGRYPIESGAESYRILWQNSQYSG
ncbi:hypothetical protein Hamer_G031157 [Homarus americanus]|uniref:Uncharacterized protein n=1 Tax=Homarus americanus TaxID=6706 RepID=A0A8J5MZK2_HOMAM|nr:hypothetical protein Hamer_G031157 [Homarus americanus]